MIDLNGQTALLSGGPANLSAGIGRSLENAGASVHVLDFVSAEPEAIHARLASFERIDTLLILPEFYKTGFFMESTESDWDEALSANYERAVFLAQAGARHMIDRGVQGSLIFISTVAIQMPLMQTSTWATSQAALYPLAKMAAVDCGPHGIRVNTVAMGWIESEWTEAHLHGDSRGQIEAGIPLGAIGTPEMVGDACCFLASPLARYITGTVLTVDGGYTLTRSEGTTPYPAG